MKLFSYTTLAVLGMTTASYAGFGPLIAPAELQDLIEAETAPLVLDIRGPAYEQGHVAGAISAPYALFRGPADNPGALIPADELEQRLRNLGITHDRPIVVVHQGSDNSDFGAAARVYWTLKSSGLEQLAILDGGAAAWAGEGLPLETRVNQPQPSEITVEFSDRWLATAADIDDIIAGDGDARLIDTRPADFFEGRNAHPAAKRPGTLPGAENLSHTEWFRDATRTLDADGAQAVASEFGIDSDDSVVAFCNTGHWAATEWFALSELAGVEDVRLYPESMVGWSQAGGALDNTPGLLSNLLGQLRGN